MKSLFLSVAAATALAVSAGSAAAQYNTAYPVSTPAPTAYTPAPTGYAPAPPGYTPAPMAYTPAPMGYAPGGYDTGAGGYGCMHGHMGYIHGHMGGLHGKLGGKFGGKFFGLGIFSNHGHPFGKDDGGSLIGGGAGLSGLFAGINGGGQIQPVDPRSGNAGQLVFPQNPFVRGPRDYFMWEDR